MGHWENARLPEDFDGMVRLFPLPNLVLFPHVIQALHIFEPRYCDMLTESLESDHLITMALLVPGWEGEWDKRPRIGDAVCIGRIISHTPTDDGRHNILLAGISRARILEEIDTDTTFRQARVEIVQDYVPGEFEDNVDEFRQNLLSVFRAMIPADAANSKTFSELLTQQLPLGILTDIISYAVNLTTEVKQTLLGEANVIVRYEILMKNLVTEEEVDNPCSIEQPSESVQRRSGTFPPPFSIN